MLEKDLLQRFQSIETPFYYYDLALLKQTLLACKLAADKYGFCIHYALKANFDSQILSIIKQNGFGADCVSGNEVKKAVEIGFDTQKIVFAGVGKSDKEIVTALNANIFCFNVESVQELTVINDLARLNNKMASIALRVNPNVDANTDKHITTGLDENKFGINETDLVACVDIIHQSKNLNFIGIHFHIGSQITHLEVFENLCRKINEIHHWFDKQGLKPQVLNVGGGLGVDYHHPENNLIPDFDAYFKIFERYLQRDFSQEVHFELGRSLVAQCGFLISRVLYVKNGQKKNFIILDAGMTELIRPALYHAYHQIENASKHFSSVKKLHYDIVGPICESTDIFAENRLLPQSDRGDLIIIRTAGAYGEVLSSGYNLRDRVQVVYSE